MAILLLSRISVSAQTSRVPDGNLYAELADLDSVSFCQCLHV